MRRVVHHRFAAAATSSAADGKYSSVKSSLHSVEYFTPRLGQRSVQIQHAHQARPFPAPIRDGQNRSLCVISPASTWWLYCQTASATISGARRNGAKYFHPLLLRIDEAVPFVCVHCMAALNRKSKFLNRLCDRCLHTLLSRPANTIGGQT